MLTVRLGAGDVCGVACVTGAVCVTGGGVALVVGCVGVLVWLCWPGFATEPWDPLPTRPTEEDLPTDAEA